MTTRLLSVTVRSPSLMPITTLPLTELRPQNLPNLLDVRSNPSQPQGGILATNQGKQNARAGKSSYCLH